MLGRRGVEVHFVYATSTRARFINSAPSWIEAFSILQSKSRTIDESLQKLALPASDLQIANAFFVAF
jgi:hypothetical protein